MASDDGADRAGGMFLFGVDTVEVAARDSVEGFHGEVFRVPIG